jgi:hypothetical protein
LVTKFQIAAQGFSSSTVLRYVFKYIPQGSTTEVPLTDQGYSSTTSAYLPAGKVTLVVYAYHHSGEFTRQVSTIDVSSPTTSTDQCAALAAVKTLLSDAEKAADVSMSVDLVAFISFYLRNAPSRLVCNGVDVTSEVAAARARFLSLLDIFSATASRSSSRAAQWANALEGVSAMYQVGSVMTAEERKTALAIVDKILSGMTTLTSAADSYSAGKSVMTIVSDLLGSGDCDMLDGLKTRIHKVQSLLMKDKVPGMPALDSKHSNVDLFVQRLQNGKAVNIKTNGKTPINFNIPASALRHEQFIDVAVMSFTSPKLKNCRLGGVRSTSYFQPTAEVLNSLSGTLVSDPINIDLVSVQTGLPITIENLSEDITFFVPSKSECVPTAARSCGYWTGSQWSSAGCKALSVDSKGVQCSCSHLTEFAVVRNGDDTCPATSNSGYYIVVAGYGLAFVVAGVFVGRFYMTRSQPGKTAIYGLITVVAICRLVAALFAAGIEVSAGAANLLTAVPFLCYFAVHTMLFARARQASSPVVLAPSKLTGLFKLYAGFYSLGLLALLVAAFVSDPASKNITMSATRVLAAVSMIAALFFGANGALSRPQVKQPNVALFRTYLLTCVCVLVSSLVWVTLTTDALACALFLPVDLIWGIALARLYRDAAQEDIPTAASTKAAPALATPAAAVHAV